MDAGGSSDSTGIEAIVRDVCAAHRNDPSALIEIFHDLRTRAGAVPEASLKAIADQLNLSRAEVYGTLSFYYDFQRPTGKRVVQVCLGEACRSRGAAALFEAARSLLADTAAVETVYCLGNCALAPSAMVDGVVRGRVEGAEALLPVAGVAT